MTHASETSRWKGLVRARPRRPGVEPEAAGGPRPEGLSGRHGDTEKEMFGGITFLRDGNMAVGDTART